MSETTFLEKLKIYIMYSGSQLYLLFTIYIYDRSILNFFCTQDAQWTQRHKTCFLRMDPPGNIPGSMSYKSYVCEKLSRIPSQHIIDYCKKFTMIKKQF